MRSEAPWQRAAAQSVDTTVKMTLVGYNVPVDTRPPPEAMKASGMKLPSLENLTPGP